MSVEAVIFGDKSLGTSPHLLINLNKNVVSGRRTVALRTCFVIHMLFSGGSSIFKSITRHSASCQTFVAFDICKPMIHGRNRERS